MKIIDYVLIGLIIALCMNGWEKMYPVLLILGAGLFGFTLWILKRN